MHDIKVQYLYHNFKSYIFWLELGSPYISGLRDSPPQLDLRRDPTSPILGWYAKFGLSIIQPSLGRYAEFVPFSLKIIYCRFNYSIRFGLVCIVCFVQFNNYLLSNQLISPVLGWYSEFLLKTELKTRVGLYLRVILMSTHIGPTVNMLFEWWYCVCLVTFNSVNGFKYEHVISLNKHW